MGCEDKEPGGMTSEGRVSVYGGCPEKPVLGAMDVA